MPQQGDAIGPYELVRRLGTGTFGEVWLARHRDAEVERAIKIPTDPGYVEQLRRESRLQLLLEHPHIVHGIELDLGHDPPYFVMEYVQGANLREHLARHGPLPPPAALGILRQVLEALVVAHGQGVLHRDHKPANILLAPDGTVKITDFGLGKVQADVAVSLSLSGSLVTRAGASIEGTVAYMSPEQLRGEAPAPSDDLYSLGIIACELLCGMRPLRGFSIRETFQEAGIPARLAGIVTRALALPTRRYALALEMLADVVGAERALTPVERPPAPREDDQGFLTSVREEVDRTARAARSYRGPSRRPPRKRRRVGGWAAAIGLVLLVGYLLVPLRCRSLPRFNTWYM